MVGSEVGPRCHRVNFSSREEGQRMPTTKHELLDWLMDVPEDAEIGTDGAGLALLAILGTNVHLLEVGHIPNADDLLYSQCQGRICGGDIVRRLLIRAL